MRAAARWTREHELAGVVPLESDVRAVPAQPEHQALSFVSREPARSELGSAHPAGPALPDELAHAQIVALRRRDQQQRDRAAVGELEARAGGLRAHSGGWRDGFEAAAHAAVARRQHVGLRAEPLEADPEDTRAVLVRPEGPRSDERGPIAEPLVERP